jgi:type II secretory pathway pseudopilin PulG
MAITKLNTNSETSFENIIVLIFIFVLVIICVNIYRGSIKYAETAAFRIDAQRINLALIAYRTKYGRFPKNLSVLSKKKFIQHIKIDKDGYPVTPFGKRFNYKRQYGIVFYATSGRQ